MALRVLASNISSSKRWGLAERGGGFAGELAEDGAAHEAGPTGGVVIEEPADQLPGRVQARNRAVLRVQDFRPRGDPEAAEGEGDPARDAVADEGRRIQGEGPVGLGGRDAPGALAVQDRGVEFPRLDGSVEAADRPGQPLRVDLQLPRQLVDRRGLGPGDLPPP